MSRFRRTTAVLSIILLLQPSLLLWGADCASGHADEHRAADTASAHDMASMTAGQHAAMGMAESADTKSATDPSTDPSTHPAGNCDANGAERSCNGPAMPGTCVSMSACASPAMSATTLLASSEASLVRVSAPEPLALRAGSSAAPELPPPRA